MRARTRSPGTAPDTNTTWPSTRPIIRPPTAGLSRVSGRICPGTSMGLRQRHGGQLEAFADEAVDGRFLRARKRVRGHPGPESRQLTFGLTRQRRSRRVVERGPRLLQQLPIERCEPIEQRLTRLAALDRELLQ